MWAALRTLSLKQHHAHWQSAAEKKQCHATKRDLHRAIFLPELAPRLLLTRPLSTRQLLIMRTAALLLIALAATALAAPIDIKEIEVGLGRGAQLEEKMKRAGVATDSFSSVLLSLLLLPLPLSPQITSNNGHARAGYGIAGTEAYDGTLVIGQWRGGRRRATRRLSSFSNSAFLHFAPLLFALAFPTILHPWTPGNTLDLSGAA